MAVYKVGACDLVSSYYYLTLDSLMAICQASYHFSLFLRSSLSPGLYHFLGNSFWEVADIWRKQKRTKDSAMKNFRNSFHPKTPPVGFSGLENLQGSVCDDKEPGLFWSYPFLVRMFLCLGHFCWI